MHRDNNGLPFWVMVLEGSKHWRILPYGANYHLAGEEPTFDFIPPPHGKEFQGGVLDDLEGGDGSTSYLFDAFAPDFEEFPILCEAEMHEAMVHAGDVIYIPNSAPHGAMNIEDTIAVTANHFHPLDVVQGAWLKRNCEEYDPEEEEEEDPIKFTVELCDYMKSRINHRNDNIGPQNDLSYVQYMSDRFFLQHFESEQETEHSEYWIR